MQSCTSFQPRSSIDLQAKLSRDQSGRVHCQQLLLFGGEYRISRTCLFYKKAAATPERIFGCTAELMCASVCLHFCTFVPRNTKWKSCTIWRLVPNRTDNSPHWLIVLIDQSSSSREQEHLLIGKRHKKKGSQLTDENITELRWSNRWYSDCIFHFTKYIKKSKLVFSYKAKQINLLISFSNWYSGLVNWRTRSNKNKQQIFLTNSVWVFKLHKIPIWKKTKNRDNILFW